MVLDLFGSHSYASRGWFDSSWMREHGNLPEPDLLKALRECTWGFSPMALDDADPRYNRFSFPTKLISYLAAGLPVIGLGHPQSTIIRAVDENGIGLSLTTPDLSSLQQALLRGLAPSPSLSHSMREEAESPWATFGKDLLQYGRREFDAGKMRSALYECLGKCAKVTSGK
jgi:hypothetical protein